MYDRASTLTALIVQRVLLPCGRSALTRDSCLGINTVRWIHYPCEAWQSAISSVRMTRPAPAGTPVQLCESSANGTSYDVIGLSIPSSRCTSKAFSSLSCTPRRASASVVSRPCAARDATSAAWRASRASAANKSESKSFWDVGLAIAVNPLTGDEANKRSLRS